MDHNGLIYDMIPCDKITLVAVEHKLSSMKCKAL